jgi:ribose transport system permease protein
LIGNTARKLGVPAFLVLILVFFSLLLPSSFPTVSNLTNILTLNFPTALLALSLTLTLSVQAFDLSTAAAASVAAVVALKLEPSSGLFVTAVVCVAIGIAVGVVNATVVESTHVDSFIVTLAMGTVLDGLGLLITAGATLYEANLGALTVLGRGQVGPIPLTLIYLVVIVLILAFAFSYTKLGRMFYATGGNRRAADLIGIPTIKIRFCAFIVGGVLAGLAGLYVAGQLSSASAASLDQLLIGAFAAAFLGSTTITPGRFNILGTVLSVYLLGVAVTGLQQLGAAQWVSYVFNGGVLVIAVALSSPVWRRKLSPRQWRGQRAETAGTAITEPSPDGAGAKETGDDPSPRRVVEIE